MTDANGPGTFAQGSSNIRSLTKESAHYTNDDD